MGSYFTLDKGYHDPSYALYRQVLIDNIGLDDLILYILTIDAEYIIKIVSNSKGGIRRDSTSWSICHLCQNYIVESLHIVSHPCFLLDKFNWADLYSFCIQFSSKDIWWSDLQSIFEAVEKLNWYNRTLLVDGIIQVVGSHLSCFMKIST